MSKKNLVVAFLLLSGVAITLAYAAGSRSNWLTDNQINFTDKRTSEHGNKLTAIVWDTVMNGLTTWAQNHEKRLQAFAQTPGYPNLTSEQTTFTDLLSTRHNNQLTAEMWNGLVGKLTTAITNHEMRLRKVESNTSMAPVAPRVDGKCGTRAGQCETGKAISGSVANIWHCEGSNGGTTAYNCQVVAIQYECVGHYDTGRTTERWEGKSASLNCYMRPSNGSSVRLGAMGCPENEISGMRESGEHENGRPRFNEFTRGFFDPTATTSGYGDITSADIGCEHKRDERNSDFNVHRDVECSYACRYNQSKHGDKCTKIVTPITESCSGFDQNRCSTTPGCTRQKK